MSCSTFTSQSWTDEIAAAAEMAENAISDVLEGNGMEVVQEKFNTATSLVYDTIRANNPHRDNLYTITGRFMTSANSQLQNTVTAVLCVGSTRNLTIQQYRHKNVSRFPQDELKDGPIKVGAPITVKLEHGDLFVLMPSDEQLLKRTPTAKYKSFFKHGCQGVCGMEDQMSLGLALRVCTSTCLVDATTGLMVFDDQQHHRHKPTADEELHSYVTFSQEKKKGDTRRKQLWNNVSQYFK